jgi:hypothetical protein
MLIVFILVPSETTDRGFVALHFSETVTLCSLGSKDGNAVT